MLNPMIVMIPSVINLILITHQPILTKEYEQSVANIAISNVEVWLATHIPQFFGLFSRLWNLINPDMDLTIKRNVILNAKLLHQLLKFLNGIIAIIGNAIAAQTT